MSAVVLLKLALGLLLGSSGPQGGLPGRQPSSGSRQATVFLDRQVVLFTEDDREANLAVVSTGRPGFATPTGEFTVRYRIRSPISSIYHVRMPYWICIDPSGMVGLHQALGGRGLSMLGTPASHGCIRLGIPTASWAYGWLSNGSRVLIRH